MRRETYTRPPAPPRPYRQVDRKGRSTESREEAVFQYILSYAIDHFGHTPTMREIADACELGSTSTVTTLLSRLIGKNRLREYDGLLIIPGSSFTWQPPDSASTSPQPLLHGTVDYEQGIGF